MKRYLSINPTNPQSPVEEPGNPFSDTMSSLPNISTGDLMKTFRQQDIVDYEAASDSGHFRYYPKGALIFGLIGQALEDLAINLFGAQPVITPFLYKWNQPQIKEQAGIFDDRLYHINMSSGEKDMVLRFNGDIGLLNMLGSALITQDQLPLRFFENTNGFRYNLSGELAGIRRGRTFKFVDMHSFCASPDQAFHEYLELTRLDTTIAESLGIEMGSLYFKTTEDFFDSSMAIILPALESQAEPAVVEISPDQRQYWNLKHVAYTKSRDKLFHVQLDLESAERYNVNYHTGDSQKLPCTIVHNSLGSIEKWMVLYFEQALRMTTPELPLWLAPTQVRIIPINPDSHLEDCLALARMIRQQNIRVDVDDRSKSLNYRIRKSQQEWIPFTIVYGNKEKGSQKIAVRERQEGLGPVTLPGVGEFINSQTADKPFRQIPEILVSKQPTFVGQV